MFKFKYTKNKFWLFIKIINRNIAIYNLSMGLTKTENFTEDQLLLANRLKVLGHPARLAILKAIIATKDCVCGDLVTEIGLAQSTISQHLKELKSVGLIQGTIEGTSMCYCVNKKVWKEVSESVKLLFDSVNCGSDSCCN